MTFRRIAPAYRESVAEHASVQALNVHIAEHHAEAGRVARQFARDIAWLEGALERRRAQIAAGTWPGDKPVDEAS
jgi:hypothetical protein